jgi:hypothetical protein
MKEFVSQGNIKDVSGYLYHGTPTKNLASIAKNGLKPNDYGNPLNFIRDTDGANFYSGKDGVVLRITKYDLPTDAIKNMTYPGTFTLETISPKLLEFSKDGGKTWEALKNIIK